MITEGCGGVSGRKKNLGDREKKIEMRKERECMSKISNRGVGIYGMIRNDRSQLYSQLSLFGLCVSLYSPFTVITSGLE